MNASKDFARDLGVRFGLSKPTHLVGHLKGIKRAEEDSALSDEVPLAERLNLDFVAVPLASPPASVGYRFG